MEKAQLFMDGPNQVIKLPESFKIEGNEVGIKAFQGGIILLPLDNPWSIMEEALTEFEEGFMIERPTQLK